MSEKKEYTEYQFGEILAKDGFSGDKRLLLIFALKILQSGRGLAAAEVRNMVERLDQANLITLGEAEKVLKRFGQ